MHLFPGWKATWGYRRATWGSLRTRQGWAGRDWPCWAWWAAFPLSTLAPQAKPFHSFWSVPPLQIASQNTRQLQVSPCSSYLSTRWPKKTPKGNMSRGSHSRCFRVPLVARKNISLVSLWALQVSISGALLAAREHKTANVREKIGRRSKALRMFMNVCPLTRSVRRRAQLQSVLEQTLGASSRGILSKFYFLCLFTCFSVGWGFLLVFLVFWFFFWVLFLFWFGFWGGCFLF